MVSDLKTLNKNLRIIRENFPSWEVENKGGGGQKLDRLATVARRKTEICPTWIWYEISLLENSTFFAADAYTP